jgi:hypothetical protein
MKKSIVLLAAVIMIAGFTNKVMAQDDAVTNAGAKIVTALTILQTAPLHFGTMTIPTGATEIILTTSAGRTAFPALNVRLLTQNPVATNAAYNVVGSSNATYAITLPANGVVTIAEGATLIPVKNFVAKCVSKIADGSNGILDGSGLDRFVIGATLSLADAQPFGNYSGTFSVSVDYN